VGAKTTAELNDGGNYYNYKTASTYPVTLAPSQTEAGSFVTKPVTGEYIPNLNYTILLSTHLYTPLLHHHPPPKDSYLDNQLPHYPVLKLPEAETDTAEE